MEEAGLLTCNGSATLPIRGGADSGHDRQNVDVTYSCATVRDSHTIPY